METIHRAIQIHTLCCSSVVEKEILWSKRCKDENLRGTVKEKIMQVSSSKKWISKPALDENGNPRSETFYSEEGLKEFVELIDKNETHLIEDVIHINTEKNGVPVEVAITYNTSFKENIFTYVNNINTVEGGTHLTGFRRGLTATLKKYADDNKLLDKVISFEQADTLYSIYGGGGLPHLSRRRR